MPTLSFAAGPSSALEDLQGSYREKRSAIQARLSEFAEVGRKADDARLFEELVYCILTAGASARMGQTSIERIGPLLPHADHERLHQALRGAHRFPRARSGYVVTTRAWLRSDCDLRLRERLTAFGEDLDGRRDFLARTPGIKGIGYKEASHYLRNIGYCGYAILDQHILRELHRFGVLPTATPPATKKKYLAAEESMRQFAKGIKIDFDELDLLLWSNRTGEILK
jgi:N-glycosylase/DNA lyase